MVLHGRHPLRRAWQGNAVFDHETTLRQAGLSFSLLLFKQATIRLSFGIAAEQSRKTSGVQALCSVSVPLCPEASSAPANGALEQSIATSAIGAKIRIMKSPCI
jgi:hypothetical protein